MAQHWSSDNRTTSLRRNSGTSGTPEDLGLSMSNGIGPNMDISTSPDVTQTFDARNTS